MGWIPSTRIPSERDKDRRRAQVHRVRRGEDRGPERCGAGPSPPIATAPVGEHLCVCTSAAAPLSTAAGFLSVKPRRLPYSNLPFDSRPATDAICTG